MSENGTDWRAKVRDDLDDIYPVAIEALKEAVEATVRKWGYCPTCEAKVQIDFPDTRGLVDALKFLAEQGHGKPPETIEIKGILEVDLARWRGYLADMTPEERTVMKGFLRRHVGGREQQALPAVEEGSSAPETHLTLRG